MVRTILTLILVSTVMPAPAQPVPAEIETRVRQIYAQKYPDNYSMQKTLIEDQIESYRNMQRWKTEPGIAQGVFDRLRDIYARKYPDNFSMQRTLVVDQIECLRFLQDYNSVPNVPPDVLTNLKRRYAEKYPDNYSMQKTLIQDQVNSYLELRR